VLDDGWGDEEPASSDSEEEEIVMPIQEEGDEPALGPKLRNPVTIALFRAAMMQVLLIDSSLPGGDDAGTINR
jgi:hypothetical protein